MHHRSIFPGESGLVDHGHEGRHTKGGAQGGAGPVEVGGGGFGGKTQGSKHTESGGTKSRPFGGEITGDRITRIAPATPRAMSPRYGLPCVDSQCTFR